MPKTRGRASASAIRVRLLALFAAFAIGATATIVVDAAMIRKPLDQLVREAEIIVSGKVVEQRFHGDGKTIYTTSRVSIAQTVKGQAETSIDIVTRGGTLNGVSIHVATESQLQVGEEVVLLLRRDGTALEPVAGLQGKFAVVDDVVLRTGERFGKRSNFLTELGTMP
jgi:hypothetical protein